MIFKRLKAIKILLNTFIAFEAFKPYLFKNFSINLSKEDGGIIKILSIITIFI